jgi:hypothetical protein
MVDGDGDGEVLDALLTDNVSYAHTNGKRVPKRNSSMRSRPGEGAIGKSKIRFRDLMPCDQDTWNVHARALIELELKNGALLFPIAYTAIHRQVDGQCRLLAMQAPRVALD